LYHSPRVSVKHLTRAHSPESHLRLRCVGPETLPSRMHSAPRPRQVLPSCSSQWRLMTGSMPGRAASMADTCVFGSAPNAVAAPENNFDLATICAWVSRPMTTSHFPVLPSINAVTGLLPSLPIYTGFPAKAGTHL